MLSAPHYFLLLLQKLLLQVFDLLKFLPFFFVVHHRLLKGVFVSRGDVALPERWKKTDDLLIRRNPKNSLIITPGNRERVEYLPLNVDVLRQVHLV